MTTNSTQPLLPILNEDLIYQQMDLSAAREIANYWKYEHPYDFYDMTADLDDYNEFISPELWPKSFQQIRQHGRLVGFLAGNIADGGDVVEIALGMHPVLTGRGFGRIFMKANLKWIRQEYPDATIRLSVASFNQRAIRVYKGCGFKVVRYFKQATNGGLYDFFEMELVG